MILSSFRKIAKIYTYSRVIGNKRSCSIVSVSEVAPYYTEREPLFYYLNKWVFGDASETDMGWACAFLLLHC